jgi:hypothetical protein
VRQVQVDLEQDGIEEEWVRETSDPDFRNVEASKLQEMTWQVAVSLAEFVREDPLESEMRRQIDSALRSVEGVSDVEEMDREVWTIYGTPAGPDLVGAVGDVVDSLAARAHQHLAESTRAVPSNPVPISHPTTALADADPIDRVVEHLETWATITIDARGLERAAELRDQFFESGTFRGDLPMATRRAYGTLGFALDNAFRAFGMSRGPGVAVDLRRHIAATPAAFNVVTEIIPMIEQILRDESAG